MVPKENHKTLTKLGDRLRGPSTILHKKLWLGVSIDTLGCSKEEPGEHWHKMLKLSGHTNGDRKHLISRAVCR